MSAQLTGRGNEEQLLRSHWLLAYDYSRRNWAGSHSVKARFNLKGYVGQHEDLLTESARTSRPSQMRQSPTATS